MFAFKGCEDNLQSIGIVGSCSQCQCVLRRDVAVNDPKVILGRELHNMMLVALELAVQLFCAYVVIWTTVIKLICVLLAVLGRL